ncbi:hypothetical protein AVEN_130331-1 [Araneus ventricosus]|uniref:Uncharacterized protein n=1 Tax=Araneus ventricosus TaxID=182803 RepID=A0A4Y2BFZ3_ARAVE|nr:hypothetical protein AVEN_130331-1 [Araneus ventricosus]
MTDDICAISNMHLKNNLQENVENCLGACLIYPNKQKIITEEDSDRILSRNPIKCSKNHLGGEVSHLIKTDFTLLHWQNPSGNDIKSRYWNGIRQRNKGRVVETVSTTPNPPGKRKKVFK